jgi:hypothetical protein
MKEGATGSRPIVQEKYVAPWIGCRTQGERRQSENVIGDGQLSWLLGSCCFGREKGKEAALKALSEGHCRITEKIKEQEGF